MVLRLASLCALLGGLWLGAPPAVRAADFREELDFGPEFSLGPRVLQALGRALAPGPELTEADEIANPSGWSDALTVDLPVNQSLLTLVPTGVNAFQILTVRVSNLPVPVAGVVLVESKAIDAQLGPSLRRTLSYTTDSVAVDYRVSDFDNDFPEFDATGFDRFELDPFTLPSAALGGAVADFRLEMDRPVPDPKGPKVFERLGATVSVPVELTLSDEIADPENLDGGLLIDVNPDTGQLSITESSNESPQIVRLAVENIALAAANRRIIGVVVLSNGLVDPATSDPTTRTISFADDAVFVEYAVDDVAGGDTFQFQAGGVDRLRLVVPEPAAGIAQLAGALALAVLAVGRRRSR